MLDFTEPADPPEVWVASHHRGYWEVVADHGRGRLVTLLGRSVLDSQAAEDAHKLAAAPQLLAALETFMRLGTMDDQQAIDAAIAAIAKARGRA